MRLVREGPRPSRGSEFRRAAIWLSWALLAAGALSSCGAAKQHTSAAKATTLARQAPWGADVARLGHHALTRKALNHWVAIEAVLSYEYEPTRPVPAGVLPDPPSYKACIGFLRSSTKRTAGTALPTPAQLRNECQSKEKGLQRHTMELLLTDYWVEEETHAKGIRVTQEEVQHAIHQEFANEHDHRRFLRLTHQQPGDERFLVESKLRLKKLQASVSPLRANGHESAQTAAAVDRAYARQGNQIKRKWIPRTECRPGFLVVECREYGPVSLELAGE